MKTILYSSWDNSDIKPVLEYVVEKAKKALMAIQIDWKSPRQQAPNPLTYIKEPGAHQITITIPSIPQRNVFSKKSNFFIPLEAYIIEELIDIIDQYKNQV